jgi:adenine-specific DNA-methyltransferase
VEHDSVNWQRQMKYMGSKRAMLRNGLGVLLEREIVGAERFVDLFAGSAAVSAHVAAKFHIPVLSSDLQLYSVALASAVVRRRRKSVSAQEIWTKWHKRAAARALKTKQVPRLSGSFTQATVREHRVWSASRGALPITAAYGGHYFSAEQSVWIDALRSTLPKDAETSHLALAALIQAASFCVASPGHTAQPFQPTKTAKRYLKEAWNRNVAAKTRQQLELLCGMNANKNGKAVRRDANTLAKTLRKTDLVFIDPPYSGVHYSRFYHVLESIAEGACGPVSGVGRYPAPSKRPRSRYSLQTEAKVALDHLLEVIAKRGAKVVLTFPNHKCSNGLSGYAVKKIAQRHFSMVNKSVASIFSSLGGTSDKRGNQAGRSARVDTRELVLTLTARRLNHNER